MDGDDQPPQDGQSALPPMPETIEIERIECFAELISIKQVWTEGIKTLEDVFAEYIAKLNAEFLRKTQEFMAIQQQLQKNHEFLQQQHTILEERAAGIGCGPGGANVTTTINEAGEVVTTTVAGGGCAEHCHFTKPDSEVIALNVGGTHHLLTEKDVLCYVPGSHLHRLFVNDTIEKKMVGEEVFIDRDGATFLNMVNYLRNHMTLFPEFMDKNEEIQFFKELDHWGIPSHTGQGRPAAASHFEQHRCFNSRPQAPAQYVPPVVNYQMQQQSFMNQQMQQAPPQYTPPPQQTTTQTQSYQYSKQTHAQIQQRGESLTPRNFPYESDNERYEVHNEDSHGVALRAAKEKWNELGPLRLEDIVANSTEFIDQSMKFGQSKYNRYIIGQLAPNGKVNGVGKEINHIIYEGMFKDDTYHGFGRFIYSNGDYYIGQWVEGKRQGHGKLVDKSGKVYQGHWQQSRFMGS